MHLASEASEYLRAADAPEQLLERVPGNKPAL